MNLRLLRLSLLFSAFAASATAVEPVWRNLDYAPSPVDNPLKGLVPYSDAAHREAFPHSMEFSYFPMAAVVKGPEQYDWSAFDTWLNKVAERGHQAVFRFYTEYPGKTNGVHQYLRQRGWTSRALPARARRPNRRPCRRFPITKTRNSARRWCVS
ncbi:MAG: hypothetical protein WCJ07_02615 [Verrucomicrobiota bacterium]